MSFWALQKDDMQQPVYLVPQILKLSRTQASWADIVGFKRRTHVVMLITNILFGAAVILSGLVVLGVSYSLATHSHTPHHVLTGGMYSLVSIFLLYVAVRMTQSCIRLARFLRQNTETELS
jgi:cellobiose-specific phosphotransferase system component IIC